eukprot:CAMPEP_0181118134 /NCGR_PEP_ID=MMETSP1071-20121207/22907_1 /TAXON_ID=35127 /ORGANISM="Thalassiosira sp., Strain NH16" /LENGTH=289 /DNA_ID=CAMNT_0023202595 /DNA_START=8 /DNA_END=877 /DNA_ORIENTATION=+
MSTTDQQIISPRTKAALQHLRRLKPLDGYSIERYLASSGRLQVRLKRRNVPVRDAGFEDIVLDGSTGRVVGLQVLTSRGDAGRGVVLIDDDGRICNDDSQIMVRMADAVVSTTSSVSGSQRRASSSSGMSSSAARSATTPLSDANNELLLKYGLAALGALVALKIIFAALNILSIILLPVAFLYACSNCPTNDSFDAKRELKRVMRGAHLPEEHQPKGFFEQKFNRLAASVTAELATSLGYEIGMTDFVGAAKMAAVKVPVASAEYYWIGILGKWRYIGQREITGNKDD